MQRRNERDFAGQVITWVKKAIDEKRTIFQDVRNDTGIKLSSGRTKFPDVLLFADKVSGIIFNGWELKFPETAADDYTMLTNALEKAEKMKSDSFVTWNGSEAIIWKINENNYSVSSLTRLKSYPKIQSINVREDLANPQKYLDNEKFLQDRLYEILHDLEILLTSGVLKIAINISDKFIDAIKDAATIIIPRFKSEIRNLLGINPSFKSEFNRWKIYESSTLKILSADPQEILAKFTFYNLIGKIIFYLTLSENLSGSLRRPEIKDSNDIKGVLDSYFDAAQTIDYQAVFKPYFTDIISYNEEISQTIFLLFNTITEFDFKILPTEVIGTILENLVPKVEKQKFGQYFTQQTLANLVTFPTVQTKSDYVFDPTSGTGTFLNSFYEILSYHGNNEHIKLLNQIWGNDISHFPSILSVINLYKQDVSSNRNFPRVIRDDFFNLEPGKMIEFPDSKNYLTKIELALPKFDSIASNFPFIRQEDIPKKAMNKLFKNIFEKSQEAFLKNGKFTLKERSDYFTYCIYNSTIFLKEGGFIGAITSNAWLAKEYGYQFKQFLLDNFHIKYIVQSSAGHWFSDSQISTIFFILNYVQNEEPTKFITLNFKLDKYFNSNDSYEQLKEIEDFYSQINLCDDPKNSDWKRDENSKDIFYKNDGTLDVKIVPKLELTKSVTKNWKNFFTTTDILSIFDDYLCKPHDKFLKVSRGVRTDWNNMYVLSSEQIQNEGLDNSFFIPYVKSPAELKTIKFSEEYSTYLFVCNLDELELQNNHPRIYAWIKKFENSFNKKGDKTIKAAGEKNKPFWYSVKPKFFNIITGINPYERYFFTYSLDKFAIDQRFVGINVNEGNDIELIAALYNSIVTCITMNSSGTGMNLGALDLNANFFKELEILNPDLLDDNSKERIKSAFQPIQTRNVEVIFKELKKPDRINFDKVVLESFGIETSILDSLYSIILESAELRVNMKNK